MPTQASGPGKQNSAATLAIDDLRAPDRETLARDALKTRVDEIVREGIVKLNINLARPGLTLSINGTPVLTDGKVATGFEAIMGAKGSNISAEEREARVVALIQEKTAVLIARAPAIVTDYEDHLKHFGVPIAHNPGDPGLSPSATKAASEKYLSHRLTEEVERCIREQATGISTQATQMERAVNRDRTHYFNNLINGSKFDLNKWIENSGLKNPSNPEEKKKFDEELAKLRKVGVWDDPNATAEEKKKFPVKPSFLRNQRYIMMASWGVAVGTLGILAVTAPVAVGGWAPVLGVVNMGVQKLCQFLHDRKFDAMFKEINRELKNAGPMEAGIAWAGVMHTFLTDHKPFLFRPNRTEFLNNHESTSMDAVLRQLRQAASYGGESIERRDYSDQKQTFFKDSKFNDYISQNDDAMKAIERRWKHFTKNSKNTAKIGVGVGIAAPFGLFTF